MILNFMYVYMNFIYVYDSEFYEHTKATRDPLLESKLRTLVLFKAWKEEGYELKTQRDLIFVMRTEFLSEQ